MLYVRNAFPEYMVCILTRFIPIRFLLAFIAYFGIGAYYNYSTYGARGMDLIP